MLVYSSLEKEYLELLRKVQKTESAIESHPEDKNLKANANVDGLKKKLKEIEKRLEKSFSLYR